MDYKKRQCVWRDVCRMSRWGYDKKEHYFGSLADLISSSQPPTNISENMQIIPERASPTLLPLTLCPPIPHPPKASQWGMNTLVSFTPPFCSSLKRIPLLPIGFLFMNIFILSFQTITITTLQKIFLPKLGQK